MKRLEEIISAYWEVGTALRHPNAPPLSAEKALKQLKVMDRLLMNAEEHPLATNMHTLKYDIIEGNTQWRAPRKVQGSRLIQLTKK